MSLTSENPGKMTSLLWIKGVRTIVQHQEEADLTKIKR